MAFSVPYLGHGVGQRSETTLEKFRARFAGALLETTGLAPITAALLRAALKAVGGPIVADTPNRRLRQGVPGPEEAPCPT